MAKKKASAKKPALKKVAKKTAAKKSVKKASPKKSTAKPASKKTVSKKTEGKKTPTKKTALKVSKSVKATKAKKTPASKAVTAKPAAKKNLDLSNFVTPLDDRLIVQVSGQDRMTPGGLYIPDTVADVSGNLHGVVLAVGRGHVGKKGHLRPMDVKTGDSVVFPEHAGSKIKIQNEDLIILREVDVMGIVSK